MSSVKGYHKLEEKSYVVKDEISGYDKRFLKKVFRLPNGIIESFFVDEGNDSVQVFALTEDENKVILVKQFRPGTEKEELELPGGGLDRPDEDPVVAARRELREETGFVSSGKEEDEVYLGHLPYSPYSTGRKHMVAFKNCTREFGELDLDDNEFLKVYVADFDSFKEDLLKQNKVRGTDTAFLAMMNFGLI